MGTIYKVGRNEKYRSLTDVRKVLKAGNHDTVLLAPGETSQMSSTFETLDDVSVKTLGATGTTSHRVDWTGDIKNGTTMFLNKGRGFNVDGLRVSLPNPGLQGSEQTSWAFQDCGSDMTLRNVENVANGGLLFCLNATRGRYHDLRAHGPCGHTRVYTGGTLNFDLVFDELTDMTMTEGQHLFRLHRTKKVRIGSTGRRSFLHYSSPLQRGNVNVKDCDDFEVVNVETYGGGFGVGALSTDKTPGLRSLGFHAHNFHARPSTFCEVSNGVVDAHYEDGIIECGQTAFSVAGPIFDRPASSIVVGPNFHVYAPNLFKLAKGARATVLPNVYLNDKKFPEGVTTGK